MTVMLLLFLAMWTQIAAATPPATGRITGLVIEARTGAPLAAVLVQVQATRQQAISDTEGRFEIADVPVGQQTLVVSVVGFGLVRRNIAVTADQVTELTIPVAEGASTYVEEVTVSASRFREAEPAAPSQSVLGSRELLALRGVLADDPFRAVQALPGVTTGDDFRGEFSVRGLGPQNIGISVDGVDSPFLFHTVRAVNDSGSLALINSDVLDQAVLLAGPHPEKLAPHLGARLDFTTRDGTREHLDSRLMVSGAAATGLFEGPIGSSKRGAWLVAARRSYIDWLLERIDPNINGRFGFTDLQGGVTYDLTPRQQLRVTFIGGRSLLHDRDENPSLNSLERGGSDTGIANLRWRFTPWATAVVTQQAYVVHTTYRNNVTDGRVREQGWDRDVTWRGSVDWRPSAAHAIELGAQVQSLRARRLDRRFTSSTASVTTVDASMKATDPGGYAAYRWTPTDRIVVSPGARVDNFELVHKTVVAPWLLTEWQIFPRTRLRVGASVQYQPPTLDDGLLVRRTDALVPERAASLDVGIEQRLGDSWRFSLTAYGRDDRDRLRLKNNEFRLVNNVVVRPGTAYMDNALSGRSRGADVILERRSVNGWSGWLSYSYATSTVTDQTRTVTGALTSVVPPERYAADYDQRHTINIYSAYRWSGRTSVSARFRYGSNFPTNGYFEPRGTDIWTLSERRNLTRLPEYARLDMRADRAFTYRRRRLTLFVEVINVLDRDNFRAQGPAVNVNTRQVSGLTDHLFPIVPSAGILVEF